MELLLWWKNQLNGEIVSQINVFSWNKDEGCRRAKSECSTISSSNRKSFSLSLTTTPIASLANTNEKYPHLFEIINSINDTTEGRVILQFWAHTKSHLCICAIFHQCEFSNVFWNLLLEPKHDDDVTLAPGRAGQATRCQTMGPLVSNWPPPSHPSCFRVLSTSIDHPFHFISLLKEYCRTCN